MDKESKQHIIIYYVIPGMVFLTLINLSFALSPPPVDQRLGTYDTIFANLSEGKCRDCHLSGVPDRHHILVINGEYDCTNCHPLDTNQQITMVRDCMQCHDTTFNGMTIRRPHHETQDAQERHCKNCHGSFVDDYDDGHFIPTYNTSMVTPDTKYQAINSSTGKKWGGCEACHEMNMSLIPMVWDNNKTHHRLGSLSGFNPPNNSKCTQCHDLHSGQFGSDSIRYCERCHGIKSLHNIQYDYNNTVGTRGSGHIGENWDCNGCHASWVAGTVAPGTDVIVPSINSLNPGDVIEGSSAMLNISGKDFITTIDGITYSSVIIVTDGINPTTIVPSSITADTMVITVPALNKGIYGIYALKNGTVKSNKLAITVTPKVIIDSAKKSGDTLVITGSGFGTYNPVYETIVNVTITSKKGITRSLNISSWSDTTINIISSDTASGDTATVNSIYGTGSARITAGK